MFFCALSGEPPQDPVVSSKSGQVYERRLIEKYIRENGTDPVSGEKLEEGDLITVKASPKAAAPRPPTLSSVPALLHSLQNEWDALVLETFQLKQEYTSVRQELSHALYAQDAAVRVVARLIKERDAAREALSSVQASMGIAPANGDVEMDTDGAAGSTLPADLVTEIETKYEELSSARKKRKAPAGSATLAQVKEYASTHVVPSLHSPSPSGITALGLSPARPGVFVTGGNDGVVQLYDRGADKVLGALKGHAKAVTRVALHEAPGAPALVLSASADKTARVWAHDAASGEYIPRHTARGFGGAVSGLALHPVGALVAYGSRDGTYALHDLRAFKELLRSAPAGAPLASLAFHPDGQLLGAGTANGTVLVYDVRTGGLAAELGGDGAFDVPSLGFSENGYMLAAPAGTGKAAVWDLRNQKTAHTFELGDAFGDVVATAYDPSAKMLGLAGKGGVRLFAHKTWEPLASFEEGGAASDFVWGDLGKEVWATTGREVRVWGTPA